MELLCYLIWDLVIQVFIIVSILPKLMFKVFIFYTHREMAYGRVLRRFSLGMEPKTMILRPFRAGFRGFTIT